MTRERTSYDAQVKEKPAFNMDALLQGGPDIEVVKLDQNYQQLAEDDKFMYEMVKIRFLPDSNPNSPRLVELAVNTGGHTGAMGKPTEKYPMGVPGIASTGGKSVKRGFERGVVYEVPRYIAEAAAHAKIQTLEQSSHPNNPYEIVQRLRDTFYYPFEVVHDPNPKGRGWLEKVMSDPA